MNSTNTATPEPERPSTPSPRTIDRLLENPNHLVGTLLDEGSTHHRRLAAIALASILGLAIYGAVMGSFQGGAQILRSMVKAPLVVFASLLLALPSLYVFTGLSGGTSLRRVAVTATTYGALLAAISMALLPISWLFSTASSSLWFVTLIHFSTWSLALLLAQRVLRSTVVPDRRGPYLSFALLLWSALLLVVSLQMATHLRPILWQEPGTPYVAKERMFFLEHFAMTIEEDAK